MEEVLQLFREALLIAAPLYKDNKELWKKWNAYYFDIEQDAKKLGTSTNISPSLSAFVTWLGFKKEQGAQVFEIYTNIGGYKKEIEATIGNIITKEFQSIDATVDNTQQTEESQNKLSDDYYEINNTAVYYRLRDGIAKNQFEEDETSKVKSYPIETKDQSGLAQLSSHKDEDVRLINEDEATRWNTLIDGVMSNMDDLTADVLDSITIKWLAQVNSPDEFIDFSYEQVLEMCNIPKARANGIEYFRAEDKIKVAKRIAALASIFIYLNDENEVVVLNEQDENGQKYEVKREVIKRLFVLDSVVLWRDKNTNEYLGIESCRIKPGSFLSGYLYGSSSTTALLSKKALEYNSYRYKYHKRLIRYLTWQWRIRQMFSTLKKPYAIGGDKGLLSVMGIKINGRTNRVREQLETVLNDLEREKIISHWEYSEKIDENIEGKKNWFKNYYLKIGVSILPAEELLHSNAKIVKKNRVEDASSTDFMLENKEEEKQQEQIVSKIMFIHKTKSVTMRKIAQDIGVSPATLSRFCNQKQNCSTSVRKKLVTWYKRQLILDKM